MRLIGLVLIAAGLGGGYALIRYYSPDAVAARRRRRALEDAQAAAERARLLEDENRSIDHIVRKEHPALDYCIDCQVAWPRPCAAHRSKEEST